MSARDWSRSKLTLDGQPYDPAAYFVDGILVPLPIPERRPLYYRTLCTAVIWVLSALPVVAWYYAADVAGLSFLWANVLGLGMCFAIAAVRWIDANLRRILL